ncbi:hypothetical protein [Hymenobacter segetis]|uniref:Uncharacterized protein n=1 Tax=Hymenobacter segetis TaxID=2025509 RepID=A0ABU9M0W6_9BACT
MTSYRQPLLLNGCLFLLLGLLVAGIYLGAEVNSYGRREFGLGGLGVFLVATWAFPFANFLLFIQTVNTGQPRLTLVYALLTAVFLAGAWSIWGYGMGGFTKVGG